jgi:hypothetical protein
MKNIFAIIAILLLPGSAFADGICKTLGGTCRKTCEENENQERGSFIDCDKYYCCTPAESPAVSRKSSGSAEPAPEPAPAAAKESGMKAARPSAKEPEMKTESGQEVVRSSPLPGGRILVCSPVKDTSALADTALKCGEREATLQELYRDNYRLIQIIQDKKVFLYYLEKK